MTEPDVWPLSNTERTITAEWAQSKFGWTISRHENSVTITEKGTGEVIVRAAPRVVEAFLVGIVIGFLHE